MSASFRLARLLALRKRIEEQRRLDLARELTERERRAADLAEAREHLLEAREQLAGELAGGLKVARWSLLTAYIGRQEEATGRRRRFVEEQGPRLKLATERLGTALRERRVIDRLHEHWQEEQALAEKRLEQGRLDETGGRQWWRRQAGHGGDDHGTRA